jgi:UDP-3-O-[3-hydroxymyristoyl] N-acetylglucosamine deacetylase
LFYKRRVTAPAPFLVQATLGRPVTVAGVGLHSGSPARLTLRPAPPDKGIVFRRLSGGPVEDVRAHWKRYSRQYLCSGVVGTSGVPILTVEHLLAALAVLGIGNLVAEIHGNEVPILDGSALPWLDQLEAAGVVAQDAPRRRLRVLRPVEVRKGPARVRIEPADRFTLHVTNALAPFGRMAWDGEPTPARFRAEIAPSRSHGPLWAIVPKLFFAATGQARLRGASPRTVALTVGPFYLGGRRVRDEPVRHRVLDLVGDLSLAGLPLLGRVTAHHPGHTINGAFVRKLMKDQAAWVET